MLGEHQQNFTSWVDSCKNSPFSVAKPDCWCSCHPHVSETKLSLSFIAVFCFVACFIKPFEVKTAIPIVNVKIIFKWHSLLSWIFLYKTGLRLYNHNCNSFSPLKLFLQNNIEWGFKWHRLIFHSYRGSEVQYEDSRRLDVWQVFISYFIDSHVLIASYIFGRLTEFSKDCDEDIH